jgi:hypothetical protein
MLMAHDATPAPYLVKSASGRSRSEAAKHAAKVRRKQAFAASWKKVLAKRKSEAEHA